MVRASTLGVNRRSNVLPSTSTRALVPPCHWPARNADVNDTGPDRQMLEHFCGDGHLEGDVDGLADDDLEARAQVEDERTARKRGRIDARAKRRGGREYACQGSSAP